MILACFIWVYLGSEIGPAGPNPWPTTDQQAGKASQNSLQRADPSVSRALSESSDGLSGLWN